MSTWEWVTLVIFTNIASLIGGAVWWWKASAADREQFLATRYKDGEWEGRKVGYAAGLKDQADMQASKDSARARKAAITRKANREASK